MQGLPEVSEDLLEQLVGRFERGLHAAIGRRPELWPAEQGARRRQGWIEQAYPTARALEARSCVAGFMKAGSGLRAGKDEGMKRPGGAVGRTQCYGYTSRDEAG